MSKGRIITLVAFIIMMATVIFLISWIRDRRAAEQDQQTLNSLRLIEKKLVTFDSIQSASQNRFLDSLSFISKKLEYEMLERTKEIKALRKRNQDLENKFNSIILPDRPDF